MVLNPNQFKQTTEKGDLISSKDFNVISCIVKTAEVTALVPGQPVKLVDIATEVPTVTAITAITDEIFGFIPSNMQRSSYAAGVMVKVAFDNAIMIMEASAAIAAGANVESVISGQKVKTVAGGKAIGITLNKAAATGDLIRVLIKLPVTEDAITVKTVATYAAGAGALPLTQDIIMLETSGAEALTLADGVEGQILRIVMDVDGGAGTLTPANYGSGTTIVFDDVGDNAELLFDGTNWWDIGPEDTSTIISYAAGAGALPITHDVIFLTTGGAEALTLADGVAGQNLRIVMVTDGGVGTLTPANYGNGTTIVFKDVGDNIELIFDGTEWWNFEPSKLATTIAYSAGAGALPITHDVIFLTTGGAEALTLADGVAGQKLAIVMVSDGGDGTLTPANYANGTTLTFDNSDNADLIFDGTSWYNVGTPTAAVA